MWSGGAGGKTRGQVRLGKVPCGVVGRGGRGGNTRPDEAEIGAVIDGSVLLCKERC